MNAIAETAETKTLRCQRCASEIFHTTCELCTLADSLQELCDSLRSYAGFVRRANIPVKRARGLLSAFKARYPAP